MSADNSLHPAPLRNVLIDAGMGWADCCGGLYQKTGALILEACRQPLVCAAQHRPTIAMQKPEAPVGIGQGVSMGDEHLVIVKADDLLFGLDEVDGVHAHIFQEEIPVAGKKMYLWRLQGC